MNEELHLLTLTTVMVFATIVVKKIYGAQSSAQIYQVRFPLIKSLSRPGIWLLGIAPSLLLTFLFQTSASSIPSINATSILVPLLCIPITWQLCLYEYNFYFNQWHWDLRLSLVLLNTVLFFYPTVLPLFIYILYFNNGQFTKGHGGYWTFSDKELPVFILICSYVFLTLSLVINDFLFESFCLSLIALTTGHYTSAAIAKLRLKHYPKKANIHHLLVNSFIVGWKLFKSQKNLLKIANKPKPWSFMITVLVLIIELGGIFFVYRSEWFFYWLMASIGFHVIVFVTTGIFFWKWMWTLSVLLYSFKHFEVLSYYQNSAVIVIYLVIISVLLYFSGQVFRPGWYTIPYAYQLHFWIHTEKGERFLIPPSFFKPYDMMFSQARFWYLNKAEKHFASNVGSVTDHKVFKDFQSHSSSDQLSKFRQKSGKSLYSFEKTVDFDSFIKTFVINRLNSDRHITNFLQPPRHLFYLGEPDSALKNLTPKKLTIELEEYSYKRDGIKSNGTLKFHEVSFDHIDFNPKSSDE